MERKDRMEVKGSEEIRED